MSSDWVGVYRMDLREMDAELRQALEGQDPNDVEQAEEIQFAQAMLLTLTPMLLDVKAEGFWQVSTAGEGRVFGAYGVVDDILSFDVRGSDGQGPVTNMMQPGPQAYQFKNNPPRLISVGNELGEVVWLKI